jgi:hypothetical protein
MEKTEWQPIPKLTTEQMFAIIKGKTVTVIAPKKGYKIERSECLTKFRYVKTESNGKSN